MRWKPESRDPRRWRPTPAALAALAVALLVVAAVAVMGTGGGEEEPETVTLGTGLAGVEEPAEEREQGRPDKPPAAGDEGGGAGKPLGSGEASFYHTSLEGKPTASGEPYAGSKLTAAHRTLPFGSRVRVTNLSNGRSVVVRINDRGPFARRRVIDLSHSAARKLGILEKGRARVRLELIE